MGNSWQFQIGKFMLFQADDVRIHEFYWFISAYVSIFPLVYVFETMFQLQHLNCEGS